MFSRAMPRDDPLLDNKSLPEGCLKSRDAVVLWAGSVALRVIKGLSGIIHETLRSSFATPHLVLVTAIFRMG
jgi:hypothetical protein